MSPRIVYNILCEVKSGIYTCVRGQNQTENSGGGRWTVAVGREERRRAHITLRVGRVGRVVHHHLQPCEAVCVVEDQSGREVLAEAEAAPRDIVAGCRVVASLTVRGSCRCSKTLATRRSPRGGLSRGHSDH
eukprot:scaffold13603_cov55-Phaeocystis_antarctica.AAC.1